MRRRYSDCYDGLGESIASLKMLFDNYDKILNQTGRQTQTE